MISLDCGLHHPTKWAKSSGFALEAGKLSRLKFDKKWQ